VAAEVKMKLAANKRRSHRFHRERFNFKNVNEVWVKSSMMVGPKRGLPL
jgi:hypothetical protein